MNRDYFLSLLSLSVLFLLPVLAQAVPSGTPNFFSPGSPLQADPKIGDIKDIVGPVELPQAAPYLYYGLAALAGAMAVLLAMYFLKRKKAAPLPTFDPADTALERLEHAESGLTETGTVSFATEVSDILRHYIEQAFNVPNSTQTTAEFFTSLSAGGHHGVQTHIAGHTETLEKCLSLCDLAKYAAFLPEMDAAERLSQEARTFINNTRTERGTE